MKKLTLTTLAALLLLANATTIQAQAPVIGAGECLYLVGAPAGAAAAETEDRFEGSEIVPVCNVPAGIDLNRDGENMIQAWILVDYTVAPTDKACKIRGSIGHRFIASPLLEGPTRAWITVAGDYSWLLENFTNTFDEDNRFELDVLIREASDSDRFTAAQQTIANEGLSQHERREHGGRFGARLAVVLLPGRTYEVELRLILEGERGIQLFDFGEPGSPRSASYDKIEVCTEPEFLFAPVRAAGPTSGPTSAVKRRPRRR